MTEHVFFDLDHTLWDFERNSEACLKVIYADQVSGQVPYEDFIATFRVINKGLWRQLEANTITHDELRKTRFRNTLQALDVPCSEKTSLALNEQFTRLLPTQTHLVEGALEILEYLYPRYPLHIISNGYLNIQTLKMKGSDIYHYFRHIITSDLCEARKPDPKIFAYALQTVGVSPEKAVYIGDDEIADKTGSKNAGLPYIHFDPHGGTSSPDVITELISLKKLL